METCAGCGAKLEKLERAAYQPTPQVTQKAQVPVKMIVAIVGGSVALLAGMVFAMNGLRGIGGKPEIVNPTQVNAVESSVSESQEGTPLIEFGEQTGLMLEKIYGKAPSTINAADLAKLKYLCITTTSDSKVRVKYMLDGDAAPQDLGFDFTRDLLSQLEDSNDLGSFTHLEVLDLPTYVRDIEALKSMDNLKELHCMQPSETDFSIYAELPALERLYVHDTNLKNLDGIESLKHLTYLSLTGTGITSLEKLPQLERLEGLELISNPKLTDYTPIEKLYSLKTLKISDKESANFMFIGSLKTLEHLELMAIRAKSFEFLGKLPSLKSLKLGNSVAVTQMPSLERMADLAELSIEMPTMVNDASFLTPMTKLKRLDLRGAPSLEAIRGMSELEELSVSAFGSPADYSPIRSLTNLKSLTISGVQGNGLTFEQGSLDFLYNLPLLEELTFAERGYIYADPIFACSSLRSLTAQMAVLGGEFTNITKLQNLEHLDLGFTEIIKNATSTGDKALLREKTAAIGKLSKLKFLDLSSTGIGDIGFVVGLSDLNYFYASNNYISEAFPLSELARLKQIDLSDNPVEDLSSLEVLQNTQIIK